jgi:hypothetical protein
LVHEAPAGALEKKLDFFGLSMDKEPFVIFSPFARREGTDKNSSFSQESSNLGAPLQKLEIF